MGFSAGESPYRLAEVAARKRPLRLRVKPEGMDWKKYHEQRSCLQKRRFGHLGQARSFAHKHKLKAYACKHCGGYHVATPKKDDP